jgi:glycosyltransferase involved in cell wall biosynthesis
VTLHLVLSFIVPAYNEELELPATIAAIHEAAQDRQRSRREPNDVDGQAHEDSQPWMQANQYEIVVVDDGSSDATAEVALNSGARIVSINRRQIAAARNAGGRAARGDILFFVDADTRIDSKHVRGALDALAKGYAGGGARLMIDGQIPLWSRTFFKMFCAIYFGLNLGAGAFLFTTRKNFDVVGGFDESLFIGEEIYFSLALRKIGRFKILSEPIRTSGRKLRMYSAREILGNTLNVILRGPRAARSREGLGIWYDGKRESPSRTGGTST